MDNIRSIITKILSTWAGIGAALAAIGGFGIIPIPELLLNIFNADVANIIGGVADAIFVAVGVIISAAQAIRAIFIAKEPEGGVSTRSISDVNAMKWSPFKV